MSIRPTKSKFITAPTTSFLMDIVEKLNTLCIDKHVTIATSKVVQQEVLRQKFVSVSGSSFFCWWNYRLSKSYQRKIC